MASKIEEEELDVGLDFRSRMKHRWHGIGCWSHMKGLQGSPRYRLCMWEKSKKWVRKIKLS